MTRMDKYDAIETDEIHSRSKKNADLYKEIDNERISSFTIPSNAKVIENDATNIDIDKIKELLEKRYTKEPIRKPLASYEEEDEEPYFGDTKEYDLNSILENARKKKEIDYEKERFKKLRDTQYDILKSLDMPSKEEEEYSKKRESQKEDVMKLMNTITEQELKKTTKLDPLDLFTDLKGNNDETKVLGNLEEKVDTEIKEEKEKVKEDTTSTIDTSFYTNNLAFTQSDFDDFNDLKEDVKSSKMMIRILVVILLFVIIVIGIILANHIFNLQWF